MYKDNLYSKEDVHKTYRDIHNVLITGWIIRQYSSNLVDVRKFALDKLDLSRVRHVLELGCGYGFFTEMLKGRLHDDADITGIDIVSENHFAFVNSVQSLDYKGGFIPGECDCIKYISESSYDLIISSYSLYFFPYLIPHISRILKPGGLFLALTHSEHSLGEAVNLLPFIILKEGGKKTIDSAMTRLFKKFSIEYGEELLNDHFNIIEYSQYDNTIFFPHSAIEDCMFYLETKKNLLYKDILHLDNATIEKVRLNFQKAIRDLSEKQGGITLKKDDGVFHCWK